MSFIQKSNSLLWFWPHLNFPLKPRYQITWKQHISKDPRSKMMDFLQFQMCQNSLWAKLDKLKCQFQWKIANYCGWKILMMDFWQFQMCKMSLLAKLDKLKCQLYWKIAPNFGGKFKRGWNQAKKWLLQKFHLYRVHSQ